MEQIKNYAWAQAKIDMLTESESEKRHEAQKTLGWDSSFGNRAQRRERERQERKAAKKKVKL